MAPSANASSGAPARMVICQASWSRTACACATCHVYVDEAWREKVGSPTPMEEDMLDFGFDVRPNSRLSCQIKVSDDLDGLVVATPERQA